LIVYRIGTFIPVPGIDANALAQLFQKQEGTLMDMLKHVLGRALRRFVDFCLGVMPYISASIIVQMMSVVLPQLASIKKEGESGRRKLTQYTRLRNGVVGGFSRRERVRGFPEPGRGHQSGIQFLVIGTLTLTAGTMFLMWLGEQITERGLGFLNASAEAPNYELTFGIKKNFEPKK